MSLYINDLFRVMIGFLPLYCITRILWIRKSDSHARKHFGYLPLREIIMAVFALFIIGLLTLTFRDGQESLKSPTLARAWERLRLGTGINLEPFRTIRRYLKTANRDLIRINIVGNIVMFVPWGLGLPLLWKRFQSVWKVTIMSFIFPVFIESVQIFVGRSVDVDDIILNFTGGVMGGLLYLIIRSVIPQADGLAQ